MATKRLKRPRDPIALAKLIGDIATGQVIEGPTSETVATDRARKAGLKGGPARAAKLTRAQRQEIARKAARARWGK